MARQAYAGRRAITDFQPPARTDVSRPMVTPYFAADAVTLYHGDALAVSRTLPDGSVDCIVTSPPYYALRDYGVAGQYGLEETPAAYVETMRVLFAELRRVLASDGTLWLNLGDTYTKKSLLGIPWRVAFALQDDGWILRNSVIWQKPNGVPESVTDRLSRRYEHVFLFSKSPKYFFDLDAIRVPPTTWDVARKPGRYGSAGYSGGSGPHAGLRSRQYHPAGRNPGDIWSISTRPFTGAHFAVMPPPLAERCITAGCKPGGTVLDPFSGSGTTGMEALKLGRRYVGIDLNPDYLDLSLQTRIKGPATHDQP